jgi:hypothetical protein
MKNPFHKKTALERIVSPVGKVMTPVAGIAPRMAKSGLTAVGTFLGVTLASAAVSRARQRQDEE